ncbi:hypothetical protein PSP20601_04939 [Pandoraea sputorum]|nr:hypothetical protein PSP20601_04939 [Pandoraea sputorum]
MRVCGVPRITGGKFLQKRCHLGGGHGAEEEVALGLIESFGAHRVKLRWRLDPFHRGGDSKAVSDTGHGTHDG